MTLRINTSGITSERVKQTIDNLPTDVLEQIASMGPDVVWKTDPYFSKLRVPLTVSGAGPTYTYTLGVQNLSCFNFGQGQSMAVAGFPAGGTYDKATRADTNLGQPNETVNNEWVIIDGISLMAMPNSDPEVISKIIPESYCRIDMNGETDTVRIGNPLLLGGGPGLYGTGETRLAAPNQFDAQKRHPGHMTIGIPDPAGVRKLPEVLIWGPRSTPDSNLTFVLEIARAISFTATVRDAIATPGVPLWTPPTTTGALGTFAEFMVFLDCVQLTKRSRRR